MVRYVGLLRAVNVGGTGKLPMADLRAMCAEIGFADVATYIASGNVVFSSDLDGAAVKAALEARLLDYAGKPVPVMVRDAAEMATILAGNPYADAPGNKVTIVFMDEPASLAGATGAQDEEMRCAGREIYVHYPSGQAKSKLRIPGAASGTARNVNTVTQLVRMASEETE